MSNKRLAKILLTVGGFVIAGAIATSLIQLVVTNNALLAMEQAKVEEQQRIEGLKKLAFVEDSSVCALALEAFNTFPELGASAREFGQYLEDQVRSLSKANSYSAKGDYQDKKLDSLMNEAVDALAERATAYAMWIVSEEKGYNMKFPDAEQQMDRADKAQDSVESYCKANYN